ncbi:MAG: hypothetical protein IPH20_03720 [Bacteroidales bacterium]|nr:hypothetical protein [Bacteroidales bacterium]
MNDESRQVNGIIRDVNGTEMAETIPQALDLKCVESIDGRYSVSIQKIFHDKKTFSRIFRRKKCQLLKQKIKKSVMSELKQKCVILPPVSGHH